MENVVSLDDVVQFGRRHVWRILKSLGATVAAVMLYTFMVSPTYESEARMLVRLGREYVYNSEVGNQDVALGMARDKTSALNSELEILRSQDLARDVVSSIGVNVLYPSISDKAQPDDPSDMSQALSRFLRSLYAQRVKDADVLQITFQHSNPQVAAKALNLLVEKFRSKHLLAFSDAEATKFLDEKVDNMHKQLEQAEDNLKRFQQETRAFSAEDQGTILVQQRRELEAALKDARNQIAGLEQKLAYLRSEKAQVASDGGRAAEQNTTVSDARQRLLQLQLDEQKLLATFSETSRSVENVREQIKLVKAFIEQQKTTIGQGQFAEDIDKQIVQVVADLRFHEARRDNLIGQLGQLDRQISSSADQGRRYRDLVRDREAAAKNYEAYRQKLQEFRTFQEMDSQNIANISVIEAAGVPLAPIWPRKGLNLLLGMVLGLGIGIAWGFALDFLEGRSRLQAAIVPGDQATLVQPGSVHWRMPIQGATKPGSAQGPGGADS